MVRRLLLLMICLSFNLAKGQEESTTVFGVLPTDIPTHNLVKYNRFYFNPTFSLVRENKKSINVYSKIQWAGFNDNPQTYLINYTSNFDERMGVSIGLHQQNEGIYRYFGGTANYSYNVELDRDMNLTFGMNLSYSQSGIKSNIDAAENTLNNGQIILSDDVILNYQNSSVFVLTPGINFNYAEFDVGVSVVNLAAYNLTASELLTDNMAFNGHVMYTRPLERRSDKTIRGMAYATMLPDSGSEVELESNSNLRYGGNVILELPELGWAQAGYNSFYGASVGIGGNINSNVSIGYTYEMGLGNTGDFGSTHEVGLAYNFETEKPRRRSKGTKSSTQKAYEARDSEIRRLKKEILEQNKIIRELQDDQGESKSDAQRAMSELERSIAEAKERESKAASELELKREEEVKLLNKQAEEEERLRAQMKLEAEMAEKQAEEERLAAEKKLQQEIAEQEAAGQKTEEEQIAAEEAIREAEAAKEQAEEEAKLAAQKQLEIEIAEKKAEEERLAAQKEIERVEAEKKAEEERLAAQKEIERVETQKIDEAAEAARLAEEQRLAAEAAEAARLAEEQRLAAEAAEAARLAEEQRLAAEAAEAARLAEEQRLAAEAAEAARLAEEQRLAAEAAEAARLAEEQRLAAEAAEAARLAEEQRLAAEAAEAARLAEEQRLAAEAAEAARLAEEQRLAAEAAEAARLAEEQRLAAEAAEAARLAEEQRLAAEAAEAARLAEEQRLAAEAAEAARLAEEERKRQEAAAAASQEKEEGLDEIKKELDNNSRVSNKIFARRDSLLTTSLNVDKREFSKLLESLVNMNDDAEEAKGSDPTSSKKLSASNRFVKFADATRPEAQIATKFIPGYPEGYYLIGNVFKGGEYANKFTTTLKDLGFNDSKIILNPENQFQYVSVESYTNKEEAVQKYLSSIDNRYYGDMWILHIAKSRVESYKKLLQETKLITDTVKDDTVLTESLSYIGGHNIENGYYLITNIFKRENYFERGMEKLKSQGLQPQYFRNPKDNYIYVYLKKFDSLDDAKQSLFSNVNNSYGGDLYILKIQ
ncbi:PorP/SprF family type IX secretion system membrane protein [Aquimarina sp. 2304DJ70-9]|uniref:PorP/SprF family type IX secretion system membrane protein n=1 Tax=Aquimarina penaris TaxID=3231044 RepID=UPI003463142B